MATNDFLPFAVGSGANVISQSAYAAETTVLNDGFQTGVAQSSQFNKVWRQSSIISAMIGQFIVNRTGQNATDDGTTATLLANFEAAIGCILLTTSATYTIAASGGNFTTMAQAVAYFGSCIALPGVEISLIETRTAITEQYVIQGLYAPWLTIYSQPNYSGNVHPVVMTLPASPFFTTTAAYANGVPGYVNGGGTQRAAAINIIDSVLNLAGWIQSPGVVDPGGWTGEGCLTCIIQRSRVNLNTVVLDSTGSDVGIEYLSISEGSVVSAYNFQAGTTTLGMLTDGVRVVDSEFNNTSTTTIYNGIGLWYGGKFRAVTLNQTLYGVNGVSAANQASSIHRNVFTVTNITTITQTWANVGIFTYNDTDIAFGQTLNISGLANGQETFNLTNCTMLLNGISGVATNAVMLQLSGSTVYDNSQYPSLPATGATYCGLTNGSMIVNTASINTLANWASIGVVPNAPSFNGVLWNNSYSNQLLNYQNGDATITGNLTVTKAVEAAYPYVALGMTVQPLASPVNTGYTYINNANGTLNGNQWYGVYFTAIDQNGHETGPVSWSTYYYSGSSSTASLEVNAVNITPVIGAASYRAYFGAGGSYPGPSTITTVYGYLPLTIAQVAAGVSLMLINSTTVYINTTPYTLTAGSPVASNQTGQFIANGSAAFNGPITMSGAMVTTGGITGTITEATNLAGGSTGLIPFQSAANTTGFTDVAYNPATGELTSAHNILDTGTGGFSASEIVMYAANPTGLAAAQLALSPTTLVIGSSYNFAVAGVDELGNTTAATATVNVPVVTQNQIQATWTGAVNYQSTRLYIQYGHVPTWGYVPVLTTLNGTYVLTGTPSYSGTPPATNTSTLTNPATAPTWTTGGNLPIPATSYVYVKYAGVDSSGNTTAASPELTIDNSAGAATTAALGLPAIPGAVAYRIYWVASSTPAPGTENLFVECPQNLMPAYIETIAGTPPAVNTTTGTIAIGKPTASVAVDVVGAGAFTGNLYAGGALTTAHNTLDNGGNASFAGQVSIGPSVTVGQNLVLSITSGAASLLLNNQNSVAGQANTLIIESNLGGSFAPLTSLTLNATTTNVSGALIATGTGAFSQQLNVNAPANSTGVDVICDPTGIFFEAQPNGTSLNKIHLTGASGSTLAQLGINATTTALSGGLTTAGSITGVGPGVIIRVSSDTASSGTVDLSATSTSAVVNANTYGASVPLVFQINSSEKMRLDTNGNLLVGTTSTSTGQTGFTVIGAGSNPTANIFKPSGSASGSAYYGFYYNGSPVGSIAQSGTTGVAYNTTSDPRLKNITGPLTSASAIAFVNGLKPLVGTWKSDGSPFCGFLTTDYAQVDAGSVVGQADATQPVGTLSETIQLGDVTDATGKKLETSVPKPPTLASGDVWTPTTTSTQVIGTNVPQPANLPANQTWAATGTAPVYQSMEYASPAWCANMTAALQSALSTISDMQALLKAAGVKGF